MTAVPIELPDEPGWSTVSVGHIHVLVRAGGALVERVASPQFGTIRQIHAFASLPRQEALQDFVHVTGSAGGAGVEADLPVVEQVIASTRITR